jgi:hypothetical protein
VMDFYGRGIAANEALARVAASGGSTHDRPSLAWGGWLNIPWTRVYFDPQKEALDSLLGPAAPAQAERTRNFRDYYISRLLRVVIGFTWWIGAVAGVFMLWRRGNATDAPWGLIAGAAAGLALSATLGSIVVAGDVGPHFLWERTLQGTADGLWLLPLWTLLVLLWWTALGVLFGISLKLLGPLGKAMLYPIQVVLVEFCRLAGLRRVGEYFALQV